MLDDLSTPAFVAGSVKMVESILEDVQSEEQFVGLLSALYDPLLNYCRGMFAHKVCDRAVFLINCIFLFMYEILIEILAFDETFDRLQIQVFLTWCFLFVLFCVCAREWSSMKRFCWNRKRF